MISKFPKCSRWGTLRNIGNTLGSRKWFWELVLRTFWMCSWTLLIYHFHDVLFLGIFCYMRVVLSKLQNLIWCSEMFFLLSLFAYASIGCLCFVSDMLKVNCSCVIMNNIIMSHGINNRTKNQNINWKINLLTCIKIKHV